VIQATGGDPLPPHYYRDNFLRICDTVESRYGDLLAAAERELLDTYRALEFEAQCLYVRLVSRVGPWFRESRLNYPELSDPGAALDGLLEAGLALQAQELEAQELGGLFTRPELQAAFGGLVALPGRADKAALVEAIGSLELAPGQLLAVAAPLEPARIVAPLGVGEVELLQLLFFGNRRQSLTEFVLSDLGIARYWPYQLDREQRLFPDRAALEEYLACAGWSDAWWEARESGEAAVLVAVADGMLANPVRYRSSERRWHRLCNEVARDLERLGEADRALALYRRSGRHPARERSARVLEGRADWAGSAALCDEILAGPWCEEEEEAALRILARVRRRLGGSPPPRRRDRFETMELALPKGAGPVELQVAAALADRWRQVHYVENQLMNALFGLAFWEQVFAPVPGAFHNPYQSAPADMYEDFRGPRRGLLEQRLARLRQVDLRAELLAAFDRYRGYQCRWVDWRHVGRALVDEALAVIPAAHLLPVWERMLFDTRENRRGFPDLLALGDSAGDYCLIEVKAPGDALQESQKRWLRFFGRRDIPAAVVRVEWRDD